MAKLNRAAFSRDDVDDAKRGNPAFDLRGWAAERGLEFLDHSTPAGYRAVVPCEPELQSNVVRGTLPGGAYGVMAHEGLEIGYTGESLDWDGTFHSLRVTAKSGDSAAETALSFVPVVGILFGSSPTAKVRVPTTVAGARVPETAGTQTFLRIDSRRSAPPHSFSNRTKLDRLGMGGWSIWGEPAVDPALVEALVAEPIGNLFRYHAQDGLFQAVVWWGTLLVRRNGYLQPEAMDELGIAVALLATRLREVCGPRNEPRPFDAPLPAPAWRGDGASPVGFNPLNPWRKWMLETSERLGLQLEDSHSYHRAFPFVPVPGMAHVVMRGALPHVGEGRFVVHLERESARPAVVLPAPAGAAPTPPGGRPFPDHGARLEVAGGLLSVWSTTSYWGNAMAGDVDAFLAAAGAVLAESENPA
jgi:hypothetical protein